MKRTMKIRLNLTSKSIYAIPCWMLCDYSGTFYISRIIFPVDPQYANLLRTVHKTSSSLRVNFTVVLVIYFTSICISASYINNS